jgi:cysteinyl-tRNA synthetase
MLRFSDSLKKAPTTFRPLKKGVVSLYSCGPTVYDYVHIGNLRYFVFTDLLHRFLEYKGYAVHHVMNITDVGHMLADADEGEDKMEVAARTAGKSPQEVAEFYTEAFFRDIDRLGIARATAYPRASAHVEEMVAVIAKLLQHGCAYKVGESVYFDVSSFPKYGKLSGNTIQGLQPGARVEVRGEKKHPADFALWIHKPTHLMQWTAPWGTGYPGWHIECSAMAMKELGETIDIHTGGEDNKFPHHEAEMAQSECATGKPFARYWLHATHLLVDGEKMSKSKKNFYTLDDLIAKGYDVRAVRWLLLSTQYRQQLNFTFAGLDAARNALVRIDNFADAVARTTTDESGRPTRVGAKATKAFEQALDDDLNVPEALAALFDFVRMMNEKIARKRFTGHDKAAAEAFLEAVGKMLGFTFGGDGEDIPQSVLDLIAQRDEARKQKRFTESDELRTRIEEMGYVVEDTPEGRHIRKK